MDGPMGEKEGGREGGSLISKSLKRACYLLFSHAQSPYFLGGHQKLP